MSNEVEWAEPPNGGRSRHNWDAIAAACRENPGKWAVEHGCHGSTTTAIHQGLVRPFRPAGTFEAKSRSTADRRLFSVYVRYIGGEQSATTLLHREADPALQDES